MPKGKMLTTGQSRHRYTGICTILVNFPISLTLCPNKKKFCEKGEDWSPPFPAGLPTKGCQVYADSDVRCLPQSDFHWVLSFTQISKGTQNKFLKNFLCISDYKIACAYYRKFRVRAGKLIKEEKKPT